MNRRRWENLFLSLLIISMFLATIVLAPSLHSTGDTEIRSNGFSDSVEAFQYNSLASYAEALGHDSTASNLYGEAANQYSAAALRSESEGVGWLDLLATQKVKKMTRNQDRLGGANG